MCAKVQVTFPVYASEEDTPLGTPLALVFLAAKDDVARLTFLVPAGENHMIRQHWSWNRHHLRAKVCEEIVQVIANGVWERLLMTEGLQEELDGLWTDVEP